MNDKCFCHLNGLAVKDATARREIETLKNRMQWLEDRLQALENGSGGSSGGNDSDTGGDSGDTGGDSGGDTPITYYNVGLTQYVDSVNGSDALPIYIYKDRTYEIREGYLYLPDMGCSRLSFSDGDTRVNYNISVSSYFYMVTLGEYVITADGCSVDKVVNANLEQLGYNAWLVSEVGTGSHVDAHAQDTSSGGSSGGSSGTDSNKTYDVSLVHEVNLNYGLDASALYIYKDKSYNIDENGDAIGYDMYCNSLSFSDGDTSTGYTVTGIKNSFDILSSEPFDISVSGCKYYDNSGGSLQDYGYNCGYTIYDITEYASVTLTRRDG